MKLDEKLDRGYPGLPIPGTIEGPGVNVCGKAECQRLARIFRITRLSEHQQSELVIMVLHLREVAGCRHLLPYDTRPHSSLLPYHLTYGLHPQRMPYLITI